MYAYGMCVCVCGCWHNSQRDLGLNCYIVLLCSIVLLGQR